MNYFFYLNARECLNLKNIFKELRVSEYLKVFSKHFAEDPKTAEIKQIIK